jgi:hypothetical protein
LLQQVDAFGLAAERRQAPAFEHRSGRPPDWESALRAEDHGFFGARQHLR